MAEAKVWQELCERGRRIRIAANGQPGERIIGKLLKRISIQIDLNLKDLKDMFGPSSR